MNVGALTRERVNQNPIRFDMTIAATGKFAAQWMIFTIRRKRIARNQDIQDWP